MKKKPLKPFWRTKKNGDITFKPILFQKFLTSIGFVYSENGNILKLIESNKSCYLVSSHEDIHSYMTKFFMNTNEERFELGEQFEVKDNDGESWEHDDVLDHWMVKGGNLCKMVWSTKEMFPKFKMNQIFRDTDKECFLNFKNGIVRITKDKIEMLDDSVIGNKYRYTTQFIDKLNTHKETNWNGNVTVDDSVDGEYEMFVKSSTSVKVDETKEYEQFVPKYGKEYVFNEDGYKSLMSGIGYLIHGVSLGGTSKMVLLQDRYINGKTREGGNGKSIILRGIEKVVKLYEESGLDINPKDKFKYQGINLGDRVFFIDELLPTTGPVKGGIQIHDLFTDITGSFKVERKFQDSITLTGSDVPKMVGCSNYIVFDKNDSSSMRRLHIVEFSDLGKHYPLKINECFNSKKKLLGYEGHWNKKDWNDFYNFMFRSVQQWLKTKPEFFSEPNPYWRTTSTLPKLIKKYGTNEVSWGMDYLKVGRVKKNHHILDNSTKDNGHKGFSIDLYNDMKNEVGDTLIGETEMKKMLWDMCNDMGYKYNPTKTGDTPNERKIQRSYFINGLKLPNQKHVIHITHPSDPKGLVD